MKISDFSKLYCQPGHFYMCHFVHAFLYVIILRTRISTHLHLQIGLDTFHWNPIAHIFIWGSILSWLVVIPISSTQGLYGLIGFFEYAGVAFEVIRSATFWFYVILSTAVALAPTIIFRTLRLDLSPHIVDDVRLLQKKEGRRLFKRLKFHRKPADSDAPRSRLSTKRTGYAYSHTEGYGKMITTGHIFGMNEEEVFVERQRRLTMIVSNPASGTGTPSRNSFSATKAAMAAAGVAAAVATHGVAMDDSDKLQVDVHEVDVERKDEENSPVNEDSVNVDFVDETDVNSSRAQLLPTKKDGASEERDGRGSSVTIEVEEIEEDPPVRMNLPGSVESPSSDGGKKEESDEHQALL